MYWCAYRPPIGRFVLLTLLAGFVSAPAADAQDRIFAMADIHGNYEAASEILQQVGLIDGSGEWSGGSDWFVQTGDYTDRGPEVRRVMDLLMALEDEAPDGAVTILIGNHEMLNIVADLRDTTPADYEAFAGPGSEERRRQAYDQYVRFEEQKAERFGVPPPAFNESTRQAWMRGHPPGFLERMDAFGPAGEYGQWLRSLPVVARKGDSLFLHAGINPAFSSFSLDAINARVRAEIDTFDVLSRYFADVGVILPFFTSEERDLAVRAEQNLLRLQIARKEAEARTRGETYESGSEESSRVQLFDRFLEMEDWFSLHTDGILWFRGYALWTDEEGPGLIAPLLEAYDVERFVVGHTVTNRVTFRFGGEIVLLDTGMLDSVYTGGQASMIEITGDAVRPIYLQD